MKFNIVKPDARTRVLLNKIETNVAPIYKIYKEDNRIVLEPVEESKPKETHWLLKPENKHLLKKLKSALKEKKTVNWKDIKDKY